MSPYDFWVVNNKHPIDGMEEEYKNQRIRKFAVWLCLPEMSEATPMKYHQNVRSSLSKLDLTKDNINKHANMERGKFKRLQL